MNLNEFDIEEHIETRNITVEELDQCVKDYFESRKQYELKESELKSYGEALHRAEYQLMEYLRITKKDSYKVSGVGTATIVKKLQVTTPKDPEDKRKLFQWIEQQYGQDGLDKYQTINYQALNSLYSSAAEEAATKREVLSIPGLDLPTTRETLSFRRG